MVCTKTGLYHNEVTFSLTPTQRRGNYKYTTVKWRIETMYISEPTIKLNTNHSINVT